MDYNNYVVRKVAISDGEVTTQAGDPQVQGSTDGVGTNARFRWAEGILYQDGVLFIADSINYTIRKLTIATQEVATYLGVVVVAGTVDTE